MKSIKSLLHVHRAGTRLAVMLVVGIVVAILTGILGSWVISPIVGWAAACLTYLIWVWSAIARMDPATTASNATREDPSTGVTDLLLNLASLGSLGAIVFVLLEVRSASASKEAFVAAIAVGSVALSWTLIHTLFTLRYARLYYRGEVGGVDFNQDDAPSYGDFAYLAFTLGMTFQVSDTSIRSHDIRMAALRHSLLSYLFGSIILATLINLVAGLSG